MFSLPFKKCACKKFTECVFSAKDISSLMGQDLIDYYVHANDVIRRSQRHNFEFCKFPVPTHWNLDIFEQKLIASNYDDLSVIPLLKYGWPIEAVHCTYDGSVPRNQKGAEDNPDDVNSWVDIEIANKSVIGPLTNKPFGKKFKVSPIDAIPKRDSVEKRIILNLSHPDEGGSVNEMVSKEMYLNEIVNLSYPSVDDLCDILVKMGVGCALIKTDLKKYYRQIYYDPGSVHLVGFHIGDRIFCDITLSMGLCIACYVAQRFSNAIIHIFNSGNNNHQGVNYIDDLAGAAKWSNAWASYHSLLDLLCSLNVWESAHKCCPPDVCMTFLGVGINSITLIVSLTEDRMSEIRVEARKWLNKSSVSRKDVQRLVGKLSFAASTVRAGRLFFLRILNFLRGLPKHGIRSLTQDVKKDVLWWAKFVEDYNGVSMIPDILWGEPDATISSDATLVGLGGFCNGEYFHTEIPEFITENNCVHINELECLAVVIALKVWGPSLAGYKILMYCDNTTTLSVINRGKAHNEFTQQCLREIVYLASMNSFQIKMEYIPSEDNRISDYLSRWTLSHQYREKFWEEITAVCDVRRIKQVLISNKHFVFSHEW